MSATWVNVPGKCFSIFHVIDSVSIHVDNRELSAQSIYLVSGTYLFHINREQKPSSQVMTVCVWAGFGRGTGNQVRELAEETPLQQVSAQFCCCLPWSGLLFTSLESLKSYKPQSL